jgi:hypothetical protein
VGMISFGAVIRSVMLVRVESGRSWKRMAGEVGRRLSQVEAQEASVGV